MARIKKKEMSKYFTILCLFFQTLCEICHSLETVESHNQAFIQTDKHLTYIVGDVSAGIPIEVKAGQVYSDYVGPDDILIPTAIQLDPPMLDFQEQPVGMPRMEHVTVHNSDSKNNLHLLSISGSTAHFHCSFFQDKIVPPGGNTTFDVVFLARQEGNVENTLYIHTSQGSFKYQVFGVGTANPYRLRPYLGARVPVNSSFSPLINMHNPHSTPLQVLEMFASEGDLHLELPTGEKEAPRSLWEIPPYETKTIMKANFVGRTENNHTAFIRIKTNHKQDLEQMVVLPVEVEVTASPGVYVATELIDFGIVRTFDDPKTVPINLINTGDTPVHISSVTVSPPNEAISVDFRPIKLQPELLRQTTVAQITFKASKAIHPKLWSGKIIIRSKNNSYKTSIPYEAKVLHGSLTYPKNMTHFFAQWFFNDTRLMSFTNTFNFSLVLYNVTLPAEVQDLFSVLNFTKPVILPPQVLVSPFILKMHTNKEHRHFKTILSLHTNASIFDIEIIAYHNEMAIIPHSPGKIEGQLDFGTMGVRENKSLQFTVYNDNPVELILYELSTDMKGATLELVGIERGNGTVLTRRHNTSTYFTNGGQVHIPPYHFAVFSLHLVAPEEEGQYMAEIYLLTYAQEKYIPILVRTSEGSLHAIPERIVFDKVFPGKIPMKVLQVHSTFHDEMVFKSVSFQPPDYRWYFVGTNEETNSSGDKLLVLQPQTNNTIGKIYFDSKKECKDECYVGLLTHTLAGHRWLQGLQLNKDVVDTDESLYKHLRQRWQNIQDQGKDRANVTIEIDTSTVQGFLFTAHVQYHWPDIIRKCKNRIRFPLTQIGNVSRVDLILENHGDIPILVQILPLHLYPNPQMLIDLLHDKLPAHFSEYVETDDPDIFELSELAELNAKPDSAINKFRKHADDTMGVKSNKATVTGFLGRGVKVKIQVGFKPKDDSMKTSLIIVRNNLTIIDAIVVGGQGGRGEMKLNNKKPGVSTLQFDITEKHLKNCDKRKQPKGMVPNFTVKRTFTLRNTGELPFYVHGYRINNVACEGYGFRVLECDGYEMMPNTSRKIDIAFTPDFTMSRIQRTLSIFTSLGHEFNYTLQATVPPHTLSKCAASLPRPNWEPLLYYSIVCVMSFILFCILVASYFEADRIFEADILKRKVKMCNGAAGYQKDKIFDLKSMGVSHTTSQPSMTSTKTQLPPNLLNKFPRPTMELSNGHIEHKTRESFSAYLSNLFKTFFVRKASSGRKKAEVPSNSDNPASENKSSINTASEKEKAVQESSVAEKSNATYSQQSQKLTLRKAKAVKRSHMDLTPPIESMNSTCSNYDRKTGNKSNGTQPEKKYNTDTVNNNKESTNPQIVTSLDSSSLAGFDDVKSYEKDKPKSHKKLRSKPDRDNLVKDRLNLRHDDKDETSSTTTDSSAGDIEEKITGTRNDALEPIPQPLPKHKKKNKARNLEPLKIMPIPDDDTDEFELTSKSRAYKKIKGQYGGDQLKTGPLDIDLPYNIEKSKIKKKKVNTMVKDPEKTIKEKQKGMLSELDMLDDYAMDTQNSESDSSPPSWDEPNPSSPADDLCELSIQTDQFAQKQAKTLEVNTHQTNISPDALTSSSRSSSYSSIVSNSSGEGANGKNKTDKRYPIGFTPFSDTITMPLTPKTSPPLSVGTKRNAWGTGSTPSTPETIGFGLQTIQESSRTGNTLTDVQAGGVFNPPSFPFGINVPNAAENTYGFNKGSYSNQDSSLTMMQRLQLDRRRRYKEHQNRVLKGEDWPGFDVPLTRNESLWDSEYNPLDPNNTWSITSDSPPTSNNGLWNTLTHSANSSWNSLMGIWGGNGGPPQGQDPLSPDTSYPPPDISSGINTSVSPSVADSLPAFSPFMSDIWSPSASVASSGWNLPSQQQTGSAEEQNN